MRFEHTAPVDAGGRAILRLLLEEDRPWTCAQIVLELGDRGAVEDALFALVINGLVDETNGLLYPTRTALQGHDWSTL